MAVDLRIRIVDCVPLKKCNITRKLQQARRPNGSNWTLDGVAWVKALAGSLCCVCGQGSLHS